MQQLFDDGGGPESRGGEKRGARELEDAAGGPAAEHPPLEDGALGLRADAAIQHVKEILIKASLQSLANI